MSAGDRSILRHFWRRILWNLVWPRRQERIQPTLSGIVLIGLSFGIGTAAYNSASNILFIALALLLACLILSGVLAWLNLRGLDWSLDIEPPLRAGQRAEVGLILRNAKSFIPTYALWFEFAARAVDRGEPARPESTITAKGIDVWAALKRAEESAASGTVHLSARLEPARDLQARVGLHARQARRHPDRAARRRLPLSLRLPAEVLGHGPSARDPGVARPGRVPPVRRRDGAAPGRRAQPGPGRERGRDDRPSPVRVRGLAPADPLEGERALARAPHPPVLVAELRRVLDLAEDRRRGVDAAGAV